MNVYELIKTKRDGLELSKKEIGDKVEAGDPLADFYSDGDEKKIGPARKFFLAAYSFNSNKIDPPKLIYARISAEILMQRLLPMAKLYSMTMDHPGSKNSISRAVLVERPTSISQRAVCELLLQTVAPNVKLEYFEAM